MTAYLEVQTGLNVLCYLVSVAEARYVADRVTRPKKLQTTKISINSAVVSAYL